MDPAKTEGHAAHWQHLLSQLNLDDPPKKVQKKDKPISTAVQEVFAQLKHSSAIPHSSMIDRPVAHLKGILAKPEKPTRNPIILIARLVSRLFHRLTTGLKFNKSVEINLNVEATRELYSKSKIIKAPTVFTDRAQDGYLRPYFTRAEGDISVRKLAKDHHTEQGEAQSNPLNRGDRATFSTLTDDIEVGFDQVYYAAKNILYDLGFKDAGERDFISHQLDGILQELPSDQIKNLDNVRAELVKRCKDNNSKIETYDYQMFSDLVASSKKGIKIPQSILGSKDFESLQKAASARKAVDMCSEFLAGIRFGSLNVQYEALYDLFTEYTETYHETITPEELDLFGSISADYYGAIEPVEEKIANLRELLSLKASKNVPFYELFAACENEKKVASILLNLKINPDLDSLSANELSTLKMTNYIVLNKTGKEKLEGKQSSLERDPALRSKLAEWLKNKNLRTVKKEEPSATGYRNILFASEESLLNTTDPQELLRAIS